MSYLVTSKISSKLGFSPIQLISKLRQIEAKETKSPTSFLWKHRKNSHNENFPKLYLQLYSTTNYFELYKELLSNEPSVSLSISKSQIEIQPQNQERISDTAQILSQLLTSLLIKNSKNLNEDTSVIILNNSSHKSLINNQSLEKLNFLIGSCKKENLLIEFSSPNIAKPLHMGHLRSTVSGKFISNICEAAGHSVKKLCFLGDWGTQFGILQASLFHKLGQTKGEKNDELINSIQKLDLDALLNFYIEGVREEKTNVEFSTIARNCSKLLESGDEISLKIWSIIRNKTLSHLNNVWADLGVEFNDIQSESEYGSKSEGIKSALKFLEEKGVTKNHKNIENEDQNGAIFAQTKLVSKSGTSRDVLVPLVKNDGSTLYLLRDIAAALDRTQKFKFNRMIYVVDKAQNHHFETLFSLLCNFPQFVSGKKLEHVAFGRIEGMSTRQGTLVLLSSVLEEGRKLMENSRNESPNTQRIDEINTDADVSYNLALSALFVHFLKSRRLRDFEFNWDEALKSVGETGVRLQYTHARLKSLENKMAFSSDSELTMENFSSHFSAEYVLREPLALDLCLHLINFEDAFWASYADFEPCKLLTYLFKLCDKTSKCLKELHVKNEEDETVRQTRLLIFALVRKILSDGLKLIGIRPLDKL